MYNNIPMTLYLSVKKLVKYKCQNILTNAEKTLD